MHRWRTEQHRDRRPESTEAFDEFKGRTIVVDLAEVDGQKEDFEGRVWLEQRTRHHLPIGWNLEWVSDRTKEADNPVALMQFADESTALLIRTHRTRDWLPSAVLQALLNEDCKKISVGWDGDEKLKMQRTFHFEPNGIIDLAFVARENKGLTAQGLKALTEHFGLKIKKESRVARSNWACTQLSRDQIQYAAEDAYFTYILSEKLDRLPDIERVVEEKHAGAQGILEMLPGWDEQGIERRHDGLYCTICNRGPMTVPSIVNVHLGGQKHKKHMDAKAACADIVGGAARGFELPPEYEAQGIVAGDGCNGAQFGEYRCKICNAGPFTAKITVDAHVGSKKHQKALMPAAEATSTVKGDLMKQTYEDILWNLPDYVLVHEGAILECTLCSARMNSLTKMHIHIDSSQHVNKCCASQKEEVLYNPSKGLIEVLSTGKPVVRQGFTQPRREQKSVRVAEGVAADCALRRESEKDVGTPPTCEDAEQRGKPAVALPPGWCEAFDQDGKVYYADMQTRVSQWTLPDHYITVPWSRHVSDTGLAYWACPSLGADYCFYEDEAGCDWKRLVTMDDKVYWSNESLHVRFWEQ
eukprot:TRINITY_DN922_c0_g1_i1.p1 TRINITY_DN922_c0_g1~~TRINITY_DN922_c0_g1_i1.p1  ORF type:complete len:584 (+),score=89.85 TRINITY_DN922_c0_g1_i1:115-1866(+)